MSVETITRDDAIFFMNMVGSPLSPSFVFEFYKKKPYYKILDDRNSNDFLRFIKVYHIKKDLLTDREQKVLIDLYGIDHPRLTFKEASVPHNITPERVRQIRSKAERKIAYDLSKQFKI